MKMAENFFRSALIFCHHLSHTNFPIRDKKSTSMQINIQIQLICISNQLLLSDTHCSQLTRQPDYKRCFMPIAQNLGSSSLLPFLHVHFHVVLNNLVPPSVDSHNPQQLSPCKLREENFPTVHGYEGYKMSLSLCHHPHPPNWEPGKSLDFSLLRISVSTLDLDHSSSWPIN